MFLKSVKATALAAALGMGALPATASMMTVIDFDGVPAGSSATSAAPAGIAFLPAVYDSEYDSFGDPIPGTKAWRVDTTLPAGIVTAENPDVSGWGPAPSPDNALDARFQPTLMVFGAPIDVLKEFSFVLDESVFGDSTQALILFLDAAKSVIGQIELDQTVPGFIGSLASPLYGVREILLPAGAYYDNISVVPGPATLPLVLTGLGLMSAARRRKASV